MYPRRLLLEDARRARHPDPAAGREPLASPSTSLRTSGGALRSGHRPGLRRSPARGEGVGAGRRRAELASQRTSPSTDPVRRRSRAARTAPPTSARHTDVEHPRYGIRLALQDVHGISDAEVRSILQARAERPFERRGGLLAAGERVQARRRSDRACGGVRWDRGGVAAGSVVCGDDDRSAAGGGSAGVGPVLGGRRGSALVARVHRRRSGCARSWRSSGWMRAGTS